MDRALYDCLDCWNLILNLLFKYLFTYLVLNKLVKTTRVCY